MERGWRRRGGGCARRLITGAAGLILLVLLLRLAGPRLLEGYARWLMVEDPLRRADAVVALSGGDGERLIASIQLYKRGLAGCLLIVGPNVPLLKVYTGEDSLSQGEAKRRIAVHKGIPPDSALVSLGATSTWEEAKLTLEQARRRGWRSILVVTDPFHTRRARATFRTVFHKSGISVEIYHLPIGRSEQRVERWWRRELDALAVTNETIKLVFYLFNHHVSPWA